MVSHNPRNGYTSGMRCKSGATIAWNDERPDMGTHVVYSATAIKKASEEFGLTQDRILHYLTEFAHVARLDLRVDAQNYQVNIKSLYEQAIAGDVRTRSKSTAFVDSGGIGSKEAGASTVYIGSQKNRKKLLRVYDKGSQLGINIDLTRFEIEYHGKIAQNAAKSLKSTKFEDYGVVMKGMIRDYADWTDDETFQEIFGNAERIPVSVPQAGDTNTVQWLLGTIAPILARELVRDFSIADRFGEIVEYEYNRLKNGG